MHPTIAFAISSVAVLTLICTGMALFFKRRTTSTPAPTSPTPTAVTSPVQYELFDPTIDEWEAQAPYPDHALRAVRHAPASSPTSDYRTRRSPDPLPDDGEPFENESYRRRFESPARDEPLDAPSSFSATPHPSATTAADSAHFSYAPAWAADALPSRGETRACPQCDSTHVDVLNVGRKTGSTLGSVAGATSGVAMALSGAEAGAAVGAIGGPLGAVFGGLTGAVIAGLLGSAAGSVAGSAVGGVLDDSLLDNYRCLSCGHTFGAQYR
ncbi:hypothetical protein QZM38_15540 [Burkholderia orbicola]|uniref:hypothetical protein n=1 Tax=Burkholderia cepacia complex TaxID=87882 RepID=UPI00264BA070|nr:MULTISPECIES: hypothetical protein [Burkholderia cepacia complex]MDN7482245.1 hypothetical protein [Burkholderia orbicola]